MSPKLANRIITGLLIFTAAVTVQAKPTSDDFNSMIEENNAAQKELTQKLAKQLNTNKLKKNQRPDFNQVGEDILGKNTSENVVVVNANKNNSNSKKLAQKDGIEKKNFKRLSQELKDIKE